MTRRHECRHETPLTADYTKLPSTAECEQPDCYWQRNCTDSTPGGLAALRSLATHHAKALCHPVVIHLRQDVHLKPRGDALATGGSQVPALLRAVSG